MVDYTSYERIITRVTTVMMVIVAILFVVAIIGAFMFRKAEEHERRGADVTKIVIDTNTEEQLGDAFVASVRLREEIGIGTLLLCNGKESKTHRFIGPIFGSTLLLATENSLTGQDQPTIAAAKEIIRYRDISGGGFFR